MVLTDFGEPNIVPIAGIPTRHVGWLWTCLLVAAKNLRSVIIQTGISSFTALTQSA